MNKFPKKDKGARTGSNLRGTSSVASAIAPAGRNPSLQRLEREFRRARRKLIKQADLRTAAKLAREVEAEWQRASLKVAGDADRRRTLKTAAGKNWSKNSAGRFRVFALIRR